MNEYRVALDIYSGPLDLLLYLIRREEIDIYDIPIARVTEQYLQYVELLRQLDPEVVSEFLVLASTLMEIKSRTLLPTPPAEESDEPIVDPRLELVRQLLEYKKFKDAARRLEDAADEQAMRFARSPVLPPRAPEEIELETIDVWDLFDAFKQILEQTGQREAVHHVGVDDTPIALHAEDILDSIERAGGTQKFDEIFAGRTRPEMIGLFLALLELIRQNRVRASQDRPFGTILLHLLDRTPVNSADVEADFGNSDNAVDEAAGGSASTVPVDDQTQRAAEVEEHVPATPTDRVDDNGAVPERMSGVGHEPDDDPAAGTVVAPDRHDETLLGAPHDESAELLENSEPDDDTHPTARGDEAVPSRCDDPDWELPTRRT